MRRMMELIPSTNRLVVCFRRCYGWCERIAASTVLRCVAVRCSQARLSGRTECAFGVVLALTRHSVRGGGAFLWGPLTEGRVSYFALASPCLQLNLPISDGYCCVGVLQAEAKGKEEKDERKRKYNVTHEDEVRGQVVWRERPAPVLLEEEDLGQSAG